MKILEVEPYIYIFDLAKDPVHISDICRWSPVSALAEIPLGGRGPRNLIKGEEEGGGVLTGYYQRPPPTTLCCWTAIVNKITDSGGSVLSR